MTYTYGNYPASLPGRLRKRNLISFSATMSFEHSCDDWDFIFQEPDEGLSMYIEVEKHPLDLESHKCNYIGEKSR
jgi:hypothetical protein